MMRGVPAPAPTPRLVGVDVVRCVALISMYVAHAAPTPGPLHVLELSEYLTMPLFALLVGAGAELGATAPPRRRWVSLVIRAGVLVALGFALAQADALIYIVLVHLGVLTVVAAGLARLPTVALPVVALASWVLSPVLQTAWAGVDTEHFSVMGILATGPVYRITSMTLYAALGILLVRWVGRRPPGTAQLVVGGGALTGAAAMLVAEQLGRVDLVPYSGTRQEILLDALLVTGVTLVVWWCADRLPAAVSAPLAHAGAMTLTLYAVQILWLAAYVRALGHPTDDAWVNVVGLTLVSLALPALWRAVVRADPWRRGPVEGVVGAGIRLCSGGGKARLAA